MDRANVKYFPETILVFLLEWYANLWQSVGLSSRAASTQLSALWTFVDGALQEQDLRQIILRMYKTYAMMLMYNGATPLDPLQWHHPDIIAASKAKVLVRGVVPPEMVLIMLIIWAVSVVALAGVYQFRRRWSERLDPVQIFRLGVDAGANGVTAEMLRGERGQQEIAKLSGKVH